VPALTEDDIRTLANIRGQNGVITSCYLDVDGSRYVRQADYERVLDQMLRRARGTGIDAHVQQDLDRIEGYVKGGFDRSRVRGVAVFASTPDDLWEVRELPVPVRSELVINQAPAVGQLEAVVQHATTVGVLAVDKVHARVFVFRLGEVVERMERTDDVGRDYDRIGDQDRGGVDEHRQELAHQHLRNAAALLWSAYQDHGFDHVALVAPDHLVSAIERDLHPYLADRLHGRLPVEPTASDGAIRDAVLDAVIDIERKREAALVEELRAAVGSNGRGVVELGPVLDALAEHRVERLLVSSGYAIDGWHCPSCQRLAAIGRQCPCGAEMHPVPDVVEHAVDEALAQSCRVDVCTNADLDVLGRIGALLRY
jgi:peptide subunit release factor 1 (eRF1)